MSVMYLIVEQDHHYKFLFISSNKYTNVCILYFITKNNHNIGELVTQTVFTVVRFQWFGAVQIIAETLEAS